MRKYNKHKRYANNNTEKIHSFKIILRLLKGMEAKPLIWFIGLSFGIIGSLILTFASLLLGPVMQIIFYPENVSPPGGVDVSNGSDPFGLVNLLKNIPPWGLMGILFTLYLAMTILNYIQNVTIVRISQKTCTRLRWDTYCKLQKMSIAYYDTHSSGDLMSRLTNDIDNVSQALTQSVAAFIQGIATILFMFIILMILSPYLTLIIVGTLFILFAAGIIFIKKAQPHFIKQQAALGILNGYIEEYLSGHKITTLLNRQKEVCESFEVYNKAIVPSAVASQTLSVLIFPWFNFVSNIVFLLFAAISGVFVAANLPTGGLGSFDGLSALSFIFSYFTLLRNLTNPLNQWLSILNLVQAGIAGAQRVFSIIDLIPEVDKSDAQPLMNVQGHVEFKNVNFGYLPNKLNLTDANIEARSGQLIAIVGPTGAGKTTIINLLTKFYKQNSGTIKIDDHDNMNTIETSWRDNISIVLQDTFLFSTTIKENIRYGNLNATDEEIIEAAKIAHAHDFIMNLQDGYDNVVEFNGKNFSQGQRQLLAIARAVIRKAPILLLDEATSSVDTKTEVLIQQALINLMQNKTSFVIAHRLSTIRNANKILVVNNGKIIEQGTHDELLVANGFYATLYNSQFKKGLGGDFDLE